MVSKAKLKSRVVFPDPFGPITPKTSPEFTSSDGMSSTVLLPYTIVRPLALKLVVFVGGIVMRCGSVVEPR